MGRSITLQGATTKIRKTFLQLQKKSAETESKGFVGVSSHIRVPAIDCVGIPGNNHKPGQCWRCLSILDQKTIHRGYKISLVFISSFNERPSVDVLPGQQASNEW